MTAQGTTFLNAHLPYVSGVRIAMRVQGAGDPLLLVNGISRPMQSWDPFTEQLQGRTVVSFDAPGVGESPTPARPLSIAEIARLALLVLEAAGLRSADILGFSHGGAVAQQLAHAAPGNVRGLVLAATSCGLGSTPGSTSDILRSLGTSLDGTPWPLPDPWGLLWQSLAVSSWSSIPFLGSIEAPTLVVCGSKDSVVPPSNSQVLAGRIPDCTLTVLPGAGHDLQMGDSPRMLARAVDEFLSDGQATGRLRPCG